jgi:hypothetical protein
MSRLALLVILISSAPATAQDLPTPTRESIAGLMELIDACAKAGGLRSAKGEKPDDYVYEVADPARLRTAVAARDRISRPAIDALIGGWPMYSEREEPFAIALLGAIGAERKDGRAARSSRATSPTPYTLPKAASSTTSTRRSPDSHFETYEA